MKRTIKSAFYGTNDHEINVTNKFNELLNDAHLISITNINFTDPCPNQVKRIRLIIKNNDELLIRENDIFYYTYYTKMFIKSAIYHNLDITLLLNAQLSTKKIVKINNDLCKQDPNPGVHKICTITYLDDIKINIPEESYFEYTNDNNNNNIENNLTNSSYSNTIDDAFYGHFPDITNINYDACINVKNIIMSRLSITPNFYIYDYLFP